MSGILPRSGFAPDQPTVFIANFDVLIAALRHADLIAPFEHLTDKVGKSGMLGPIEALP
jgi:hypothetical protein